MSRLSDKFEALSRVNRKALIPFITAGDPHPRYTVPLMHAMVEAGADIIELGVPFSDPMADGPVIQRASERALAHKVNLSHVLEMVSRFREGDRHTPVVLMGYLNPLECMGYEKFAALAEAAELDGILTVDMPFEEYGDFLSVLERAGIDPIFLLAPNSDALRIQSVGKYGRGYLYYVSLKGVTGASHLQFASVEKKLGQIRGLTRLPVAIGFGVKDADTAAAIADLADGVVVGSALIENIEKNLDHPEKIEDAVISVIRPMREAMDSLGEKQRDRA